MKTKTIFGITFVTVLSLGALTGCGRTSGADKYDKNGRLILELQNAYFGGFTGTDEYTEILNDKFNVNIQPSNFTYNDWDQEVFVAIGGNDIMDTVHYNLKAYNIGSSYEKWVEKKVIKALPEDMSRWPEIEKMLSNISNLDALKMPDPDDNGKLKLFAIPVANDISAPEKDFSNMTYVYRRDWAKEIDEANPGSTPVYKEGDVYTWEEFERLVKAFKKKVTDDKLDKNGGAAIMDESWGFPSVTNFYKDVPHCFAKDETGRAINAFTSDKYTNGLKKGKEFVDKLYYSASQFNFNETDANTKYAGGLAGILYDNFSLSNYNDLRKNFKSNNKGVNVDDGTAFLKIKGDDGKFAIEGTENWFSVTMFNYDISQTKQEKILDILNYLLTEEGTRFAIYGKEGTDYIINDKGEVELTSRGWERSEETGEYAPKPNGAKYLRYMVTLGNDTKAYDPFTEMEAFNILNAWQEEMKTANKEGNLRVVKEPSDISWMSTEHKDKTKTLLSSANKSALKYCYNKLGDIDGYIDDVNKQNYWKILLDEINEKLGFTV